MGAVGENVETPCSAGAFGLTGEGGLRGLRRRGPARGATVTRSSWSAGAGQVEPGRMPLVGVGRQVVRAAGEPRVDPLVWCSQGGLVAARRAARGHVIEAAVERVPLATQFVIW